MRTIRQAKNPHQRGPQQSPGRSTNPRYPPSQPSALIAYISKLDRISPQRAASSTRSGHRDTATRNTRAPERWPPDADSRPFPQQAHAASYSWGLLRGRRPKTSGAFFVLSYVPRTVLSASSGMVARAPSSGVRASLCRCVTPRRAKACSGSSTACYPPGASVAFLVV